MSYTNYAWFVDNIYPALAILHVLEWTTDLMKETTRPLLFGLEPSPMLLPSEVRVQRGTMFGTDIHQKLIVSQEFTDSQKKSR